MKMKRKYLLGPLITLGIVYGDIGTSPLYVMNALVSDAGGLKKVTADYVLGEPFVDFLDPNADYNG